MRCWAQVAGLRGDRCLLPLPWLLPGPLCAPGSQHPSCSQPEALTQHQSSFCGLHSTMLMTETTRRTACVGSGQGCPNLTRCSWSSWREPSAVAFLFSGSRSGSEEKGLIQGHPGACFRAGGRLWTDQGWPPQAWTRIIMTFDSCCPSLPLPSRVGPAAPLSHPG